jgi:hypothetical protein
MSDTSQGPSAKLHLVVHTPTYPVGSTVDNKVEVSTMATPRQLESLLSVTCPWCGAEPGKRCHVRASSKRPLRPTTLDGEAHDARWQVALSMPAPVLAGRVAEYRESYTDPDAAPISNVMVEDRPW